MADDAVATDPWSDVMAAPGTYTAPEKAEPSKAPAPEKNDPWSNVMAEPGSYNAPAQTKKAEPVGNLVDIPRGTEQTPTPWTEVGKGFVANVIPSTAREIFGTAEGLGHAIMHPIDTAQGVGQLAKGLYSKEEGFRGVKQDPAQKTQDEALLDAFMESYKDKYGNLEGFKHTLANNPASIAMDFATIASGGELAAGKLASVAGTASKTGQLLGKAGEVAGTAAKYTNPLTPAVSAAGAIAEKVGAPIAGAVAKQFGAAGTEPIWDATSGSFTQPVQDLIKSHFEGRLDPSSLHGIKDQITAEMKAGGINPASLNQALLKSQNMEPTTNVVTGVRAPDIAGTELGEIKKSNFAQAKQNAENIAGGPMPNTPVLGEALEQMMQDAKTNYTSAYNTLDANADRLHPAVFSNIMPELHSAFEAKTGTSIDPAKFAQFAGQKGLASNRNNYPGTTEAMKILAEDLSLRPSAIPLSGGYQGPAMMPKVSALGPITQKNINEIRKSLNDLWGNASEMDRRGIDTVKQVLDGRIDSAYNSVLTPTPGVRPMVFGPNNRPLTTQQAAQTNNLIKDANSKFADYKTKFGDTSTDPTRVIARAAKQLKDSFSYDPASQAWIGQATPEMQNVAQGILLKGMTDPKSAAAIYDNLAGSNGVFASSPQHVDMLNQMLRSSVLNASDPSLLPKNIDNFLSKNKQLADKVFTSDQQNSLKRISESIKILQKSQNTPMQTQTVLGNIAKESVRAGVVVGAEHFLGPIGAYFLGRGSHHIGKMPMSAEKAMEQQRVGAPALPYSAFAPEIPAPFDAAAQGAAQAAGLYQANAPQQRKAGGRVSKFSAENRAEKLIRMAETAKKHVNKTTETLLQAPDEAVAKALKIAQAHI